MAIETTPKDITPIKRKGIDIAVSGLRKVFPFVVGYTDDVSKEKYESAHYIDLLINMDKLAKYMGTEILYYAKDYIKENPGAEKIYAIWGYLKFSNEDLFGDVGNNPGYKLQKEMEEELMFGYEFLPEEYRLFYQSESMYIENKVHTYPVHLRINAYIML